MRLCRHHVARNQRRRMWIGLQRTCCRGSARLWINTRSRFAGVAHDAYKSIRVSGNGSSLAMAETSLRNCGERIADLAAVGVGGQSGLAEIGDALATIETEKFMPAKPILPARGSRSENQMAGDFRIGWGNHGRSGTKVYRHDRMAEQRQAPGCRRSTIELANAAQRLHSTARPTRAGLVIHGPGRNERPDWKSGRTRKDRWTRCCRYCIENVADKPRRSPVGTCLGNAVVVGGRDGDFPLGMDWSKANRAGRHSVFEDTQ